MDMTCSGWKSSGACKWGGSCSMITFFVGPPWMA
jgi:hypothetical protein